MKGPSPALLSRAPIVLVCDVKIPKRLVLRHVAPFVRDNAGNPMARCKFLTRPFRRDGSRYDQLSDEELAAEIWSLYEKHWQGKICLICTADQGFYDVARRVIRKSSFILIKIPLFGRQSFSRRRTALILATTLVPLIRKVFDKYRKDGYARALAFSRRRALELRTVQ